MKGDTKMRKTGIFILLFLTLGVIANCHKEESGPAEARQEVPAVPAGQIALKQGAGDMEESQAGSAETGTPTIAFDQKDYDFGKLETGEKVEHVYKFRNTGDALLVINKVRSS